jgi:hypothetical protein
MIFHPLANIFEYSNFVFIRRVEQAAGAWLDGMQASPFRGGTVACSQSRLRQIPTTLSPHWWYPVGTA